VDGLGTILASQLAGALVNQAIALVGRASLGSREQGALASVARRSAASVADRFPVSIPETGRISVGRATRWVKVLIDLNAEGVQPVRLLFSGDSYIEDRKLQFNATSSNYGAIRVALTIDGDGRTERRTTAKFFIADDVPFTLAHQSVLQRTLACMGRGARLSVDFIDPPITRGIAQSEPVPGLEDAFEAAEAFAKVDELQKLLGLDLPALESLSGEDYALVLLGIGLVENDEAKVAASGEFSLRGDQSMADQGPTSFASLITCSNGPAPSRCRLRSRSHTRSDDGGWTAKITYSANDEQSMQRLTQEAG
jgi:hypothetical protein